MNGIVTIYRYLLLAALVFATILPSGIAVLCVADDGHVAIEALHDETACASEQDTEQAARTALVSQSESCDDIDLVWSQANHPGRREALPSPALLPALDIGVTTPFLAGELPPQMSTCVARCDGIGAITSALRSTVLRI